MEFKVNLKKFFITNLLILISATLSYLICENYLDNPFLNQTLFAVVIILTNMEYLKTNKWKALIFYISVLNVIFFLSIFISVPLFIIFRGLGSYLIIVIPFLLAVIAGNKILQLKLTISILLTLILAPLPLFLTEISKNNTNFLKSDPWTIFFWLQIVLGLILTSGLYIKIEK